MPRVLLLFNKPRAERIAAAARGQCPDELLYGMGALGKRGWETLATDEGFAPFFGHRLLKALDNRLSRGGRRTGFHLKQAWRLRRLIRRVDVVFATADSSGLPVLFLRWLGVVRTPVVYSSIGLAGTFGRAAGPLFRLYRLLLRRAARVLTYSQPEAAALRTMFDLPEVRFVPFGVEAEFFAIRRPSGENPLAFGLDHRRDWPTLFAAAATYTGGIDLVANPDVLRRKAIPSNVRLLPPEPVHELRERLAAAPFVVLPVRENNYSGGTISLLQAMAAGKAVIVSRTAAVREGYGLADGENCLLVPPGDGAALAEAMERLRNDRDLAARLGAEAASHVRRRFTVAHLADALDRLLREARG